MKLKRSRKLSIASMILSWILIAYLIWLGYASSPGMTIWTLLGLVMTGIGFTLVSWSLVWPQQNRDEYIKTKKR